MDGRDGRGNWRGVRYCEGILFRNANERGVIADDRTRGKTVPLAVGKR